MKRLSIILGFIAAVLAVVLAVTPLSNLAVFPIIIGFICGLVIFFITRRDEKKTKSIQYIFLLVIIALSLTIYKGVFTTTEIGNIEELETKDEESEEDAKELLEGLDLDDVDTEQ